MYVKRFGVNTLGRDIACGDVHGHFDEVDVELERIGYNKAVDRLFIVGDLVDRGPKSHEAAAWLAKHNAESVRGNHDNHLVNYATRPKWLNHKDKGAWFKYLDFRDQDVLLDKFNELPVLIEVATKYGVVGIVHAACNFDSWTELVNAVEKDTRRKSHKLVMNECFHSRIRFNEKDARPIKDIRAVVVGHNPVPEVLKLGNTYYIDTEGWRPGIGKFTLFNLNGLRAM